MAIKQWFYKIFKNPNKKNTQQYYQDSISASSGSTFVNSEKNIVKIPEFMSAIDMIANDMADIKYFDTKIEYHDKNSVLFNKIKTKSNWNVLLNRTPNDFQSSVEFWKNNIFNLLIRGAFYFYIYRDKNNAPKEFIPIHPNSIKKIKDKDGNYAYEVTYFDNEYAWEEPKKDQIPFKDIFSMYWFDLENINDFEFRTAYSSLLEQLGLANNYDLVQLNQSPRILAHVKVPDNLTDEARKDIKNSMKTFFQNAKNINSSATLVTDPKLEVEILGKGKTQVESPLSSEFRKSIMVKLANALHIPLPKLNVVDTGQSFYKSREGINIDYISDAIRPIALKIVSKLNSLEYPMSKKSEFIFKLDKLMQIDFATRGEYTAKMRQNGVSTQNELRVLNNLAPIEDGDKIYGNGTLVELGTKPQEGGKNGKE